MSSVLMSDADPGVVSAVKLAILRGDLGFDSGGSVSRSPWWRAGLEEGLGRDLPNAVPSRGYDATPPPRSTRGATRA